MENQKKKPMLCEKDFNFQYYNTQKIEKINTTKLKKCL